MENDVLCLFCQLIHPAVSLPAKRCDFQCCHSSLQQVGIFWTITAQSGSTGFPRKPERHVSGVQVKCRALLLLVLGLLHRYCPFLSFQPPQASGFFHVFGFCSKSHSLSENSFLLFILTLVLWKWHQLLCYFMLSLGQSWVWTLNSCPTQVTKQSAQNSVLHCQALQRGAEHP